MMFGSAILLTLAAMTAQAPASNVDQADCGAAAATSGTPDYMAMMMGEAGSNVDIAPKVKTGLPVPPQTPVQSRPAIVPGTMAGMLKMDVPVPVQDREHQHTHDDLDQQAREETAGICSPRHG